jgi:hypothetical protein
MAHSRGAEGAARPEEATGGSGGHGAGGHTRRGGPEGTATPPHAERAPQERPPHTPRAAGARRRQERNQTPPGCGTAARGAAKCDSVHALSQPDTSAARATACVGAGSFLAWWGFRRRYFTVFVRIQRTIPAVSHDQFIDAITTDA